jgi:hypothetical protein
MDEHRRSARRKLAAFTPVYNSSKSVLLGYLGDLSLEGAMLIGEKPMEIDTEITLIIDFPQTPEFSARQLRTLARVAWCRREENTQYFHTGVEFQKLDPMYKPFLEAILERYQFHRETPT